MYFDLEIVTFIPHSRLEYFILSEREKDPCPSSVHSEPLNPRARGSIQGSHSTVGSPTPIHSSTSSHVAKEVGLSRPKQIHEKIMMDLSGHMQCLDNSSPKGSNKGLKTRHLVLMLDQGFQGPYGTGNAFSWFSSLVVVDAKGIAGSLCLMWNTSVNVEPIDSNENTIAMKI